MAVLVTRFKKSHQDKDGYLSANEMMNDGCSTHIFKGCLKIKPNKTKSFSQWLVYWEDFPFAILCTTHSTWLANGDVKVSILTKELKTIEEIGEYTSKRNYEFGELINSKFVKSSDLQKTIMGIAEESRKKFDNDRKKGNNKTQEKISDDKMKEYSRIIAENWGCKLKNKD